MGLVEGVILTVNKDGNSTLGEVWVVVAVSCDS